MKQNIPVVMRMPARPDIRLTALWGCSSGCQAGAHHMTESSITINNVNKSKSILTLPDFCPKDGVHYK